MTAPVWVRLSSVLTARAMPKSVTLTWPSSVIRTLPGLTSRWIDAVLVGVAEGGGHVGADVGGPLGRQRAGRLEDRRQRAAVDVLHDDEVGAGVLAPVEDRDDVRVGEVGRRLGLPAEPLDERAVHRQLGKEDLERHRSVEQPVVGAVHLGHAAAGDQVVQFVALGEDTRRLVGIHVGQSLCLLSLGSGVLRTVLRDAAAPCAVGRLTASPPGRRRGWSSSAGPRSRRRWRCAGWFGTATATATFGSLAGAKAIIQSLVRVASGPVSAVPVLAATSHDAGNPTLRRSVPLVTTACISEVTAAAVSGLVAVSHGLGWYVVEEVARRVVDVLHDVGRHDHPAVGDAGGHQAHLQRPWPPRLSWPNAE